MISSPVVNLHLLQEDGMVNPRVTLERVDNRAVPAIYDFFEEKQFYWLTAKGMSEELGWQDSVRVAHPEFG